MSATYCLAYTPNKPGQRCGRAVDDPELLRCAKHAREFQERERLRDVERYAGHTIAYEHRTRNGDLRDDPFYYVTEHLQASQFGMHITPRRAREEVDRCNAERLEGCCALEPPPPPVDCIAWGRFLPSADGLHR